MFSIIAAISNNNGIGMGGTIPWSEPVDMRYFKQITSNSHSTDKRVRNAIVMGRNTYASLNGRVLPNRVNVCISSSITGENIYTNLQSALDALYADPLISQIFIIGGGQLYREAIVRPDCKDLYINHIDTDLECDVFFPHIDHNTYALCNTEILTPTITARYYRNKQTSIV
jgi:dihydrofolate reductase/thymidylate synthase